MSIARAIARRLFGRSIEVNFESYNKCHPHPN